MRRCLGRLHRAGWQLNLGQYAIDRPAPLVGRANDVVFAGKGQVELVHAHRFLRRLIAHTALASELLAGGATAPE